MNELSIGDLKTSQYTKIGSVEIANLIRKEIVSGKLSYPQRLPSERISECMPHSEA